jgi:hypothetical protein
MAFPVYKTRQDLEKLLANGAVENTELEFKDSRSLVRDEGKITELCINVSALANSAGGQIIYGINENKKTKGPIVVDEGVEDPSITRDWISQILNARIKPRLTEYSIDPINLHNGQLGFVISVPQTSIGPHQAPDNRYYRRIGVEVRAMEDYEVRDILRRSTTPDLFLNLRLSRGDNTAIEFTSQSELSQTVFLSLSIGNRSPQPAFYTVVKIGIHASINVLASDTFSGAGSTNDDGTKQNWYMRSLMTPPSLPLFKEADTDLGELRLRFHERMLASVHRLKVSTIIQTPGQYVETDWFLHIEGMHLRLLEPGHPFAR